MMQRFSKVRLRFLPPNLTTQILPSFLVLMVVLGARSLGLLEPLELIAFDTFLKLRPAEVPDDRITLIKIDADDIQRWGGYPIANDNIVQLIEQLQPHQPTAIGVNLLDDLLPDDNQSLVDLFQTYDNLVIAEKVLPPQIRASKGIRPKQVGFVDTSTDQDGYLRRIFLGSANPVDQNEFKFSFAIRLAVKYLADQGYSLENGIQNTDAMRFGDTEIPLLEANHGGYVDLDAGGVQTLINYRQTLTPFQELSPQAIENNQFSPHQITDKIIIIGVTDVTTRGKFKTPLTAPFAGLDTTGVDIQGEAISQIISAVLDDRALLRSHPRAEQSWLIACILACFLLGQGFRLRQRYLVPCLTIAITIFCFCSLRIGHWYSFATPISFLSLNGFSAMVINRIQKEQEEKHKEQQKKNKIARQRNEIQKQKNKLQKEYDLRKEIIERIFSIMHNGPLQTLSSMIREAKLHGDDPLISKLERLDTELRRIGELSKSNSHDFYRQFYLGNNETLDLDLPTHELFYQLFNKTIERELSEFKKIKVKIRSFEPIEPQCEALLGLETKRELCCFLEEMLCNVEKHGVDVSRLKAIGNFHRKNETYILRIEDNGSILEASHPGQGTQHAERLAAKLNGSFHRTQMSSGGTRCELKWHVNV